MEVTLESNSPSRASKSAHLNTTTKKRDLLKADNSRGSRSGSRNSNLNRRQKLHYEVNTNRRQGQYHLIHYIQVVPWHII